MKTSIPFIAAVALALTAAIGLTTPELSAQQSSASGTVQTEPLAPSDIAAIERYLNQATTLKARFTQFSQGNTPLVGTIYVSRPGRMRIEYDPPIPYLYVADGTWLTFFDTELGQRSDVLLGSTLADFIVRPDVKLSGDVTVRQSGRTEGGELWLELVETEDPAQGSITLFFRPDPIELVRWLVIDAQGLATEVQLGQIERDLSLDRSLFSTTRIPARGG